jgi:type I restriction enzyme S subunit
MNANILNQLDPFSIAHGGINHLMTLIFNLATTGKIDTQIPGEQHPRELLDLVKHSEVRNENIPGWLSLKLSFCADIFNGNSTSASEKARLERNSSGLNYIATKDVKYGFESINYDTGLKVGESKHNFKVAPKDALLICLEGGSAGKKMGLIEQEVCFGNKLFAVVCKEWLKPEFLLIYFLSSTFQLDFQSRMSGIIGGISKAKFSDITIPIPPLAEQQRIIEKVNQLVESCGQLADKQTYLKEVANAAQKSAISALSKAQSEDELQDSWELIKKNWQIVAGTPGSIDTLRALILELEMKRYLTKDADSHVKNFRWTSASLYEVCEYIQRGKSPKYAETGVCLTVSQKCVQWRGFDPGPSRFIDDSSLDGYSTERFLREGDLLWNSTGTGTVGRTAIFRPDDSGRRFVADSHVTVLRSSKVDPEFLYYWSRSTDIQEEVLGSTTGSTNQQELNLGKLRELSISFPELAEQKNAVGRIKSLFSLCDELEHEIKKLLEVSESFVRSVVSASA